jgi:hypothetical protein
MKKFENLGKKLSKEEQKKITGGVGDSSGCKASGELCSQLSPCCLPLFCELVGSDMKCMA